MTPVTDQDLPQDGITVNEDGSVDILEFEDLQEELDFYTNLAEVLPEPSLVSLARELIDAIDRDSQARAKRDKQYEDGLRRTGLGNDAPGGADFEGASDVVHPALAEACVDFCARAIKELFPPQGPVKTAVIGAAPEAQLDRAERKRTYMNWQLTTQMPEYRAELEQLLTQLPLGGSQFQKFWHDERFGRPVSEFVPIDDILLPYAASSFYTAQRVTHVQHITQFEFEKRVNSGLYRNLQDVMIAPGTSPEQSAAAIANDKIEGKEEDAYNEDGLRNVYEVYCWQVLDDKATISVSGDNAFAPYIITVDAYSEKILAIYRNWEEQDESLEKLDWFVEWKFIPWRGAYGIGFPQLIGSLAAAATGSLRALLDSAHINNSMTLVKLKGGKFVGQNITVEQTGITEVEGPAGVDDIRKLLMAMPYNPPSPILFQLLGWLTEAAKNVVRTTEGAIANVGDRTPVGTTQALIEQGSATYSAIHARLHESQKKALQILCRINRTWLDEEEEVEELGKLIIRREDFVGSMDVIPVSDPAIFSEVQRYAQNQSLLQMQAQDAQDPTIPWNKVAIRRRMLKQMRVDSVDEILPLPPRPVSADPLTEVSALLKGQQIQINVQQNHQAHIQAHLDYISNPVVLQNPLVPGPALMQLLQHIQQHADSILQQAIAQVAQQILPQAGNIDTAVAIATAQVMPQMASVLGAITQKLAQLQQVIQAKIPPPPLPPEIQATLKIAEMENTRKTKLDEATLNMKGQQQQLDNALEQNRLYMEQTQQRFDQFISKQQLMLDDQKTALAAQIDLLVNRQDNEQKQMTELLKNRDDNQTKLLIELRAQVEAMKQPAAAELTTSVDLGPQIEKMQGMLDQINQTKTNDALASVILGLQTTMETLQRPRRTQLEVDASGKPLAAISNLV